MKSLPSSLVIILLTSFMTTAQNVGVGTTNPSDALHVVSGAGDDALRVQVGGATKMRLFNNGGTSLGTNNASGTPTDGLYVHGNTGMGISNPSDRLSVNGNVNVTGEIKANGTSGEEGQVLRSNGDGTMNWADPCNYHYFEDFFNPVFNPQSWTVPAGVTEIMVELWGGGGGGDLNFGGGAGGYVKFLRVVTPGEVISFVVGEGGTGISNSGTAAIDGEDTSFPHPLTTDVIARGGSRGQTGLGGFHSIPTAAISSFRIIGGNGSPRDINYFQISSTEFATKTTYGDGGHPANFEHREGFGGYEIINNNSGTPIISGHGRVGRQPGGGGGGAAGTTLSVGGKGGDGYVVIRW